MELPISTDVNVSKLNKVFGDTTNSYKFYWFLAILDSIKNGNDDKISMDDIAIHMVANVWYPLDYYKLSFGKQDGFKKIAEFISERMTINHAEKAPDLFVQIKNTITGKDLSELTKMVKKLLDYVPFRFVRPFFEEELRGETNDTYINRRISEICTERFETMPQLVMYKFEGDYIRLNPPWAAYLKSHLLILQAYTYWHLIRYLQKNNPNIPGLSEKLFKNNNDRNLTVATYFWKPFLTETPDFRCIYSNNIINVNGFSLDHFLPWSFVVHNLLWNLVPVPKSINSSKSDWLPDWNLYFPLMAESQFNIVNYHLQKGNLKKLEDYTNILLDNSATDLSVFTEKLRIQLSPQFQIAQNAGFSHPYICKK
jgi:hypothetical protein